MGTDLGTASVVNSSSRKRIREEGAHEQGFADQGSASASRAGKRIREYGPGHYCLQPSIQRFEPGSELTDPRLRPRYSGVATAFRSPLTQNLDEVDIGVIGTPVDLGVTENPGAKHGPRHIREASTVGRKFHERMEVEPYRFNRVADLNDVVFPRPFELEHVHETARRFYTTVVTAKVTPLMFGGSHDLTRPALKAISSVYGRLALVHIDSHGDTGDEDGGHKLSHGTPFRRAVEEGSVDPHRTVQIGLGGHSNSREGLWAWGKQAGFKVFPRRELESAEGRAEAVSAVRALGDHPTYLSIDIDVLNERDAPQTGTVEPGGISLKKLQAMLAQFKGVNFVGADIMEVAGGGATARSAAAIANDELCLLATAKDRRRLNDLGEFSEGWPARTA